MSRRLAVVAYDVACHRARRRVRSIVEAWRLDGQKSVHECLLTRREAEELFLQLAAEMDPDGDSLLLCWVSPRRPGLAFGRGRNTVPNPAILQVR